jgi:hypothetical protein
MGPLNKGKAAFSSNSAYAFFCEAHGPTLFSWAIRYPLIFSCSSFRKEAVLGISLEQGTQEFAAVGAKGLFVGNSYQVQVLKR